MSAEKHFDRNKFNDTFLKGINKDNAVQKFAELFNHIAPILYDKNGNPKTPHHNTTLELLGFIPGTLTRIMELIEGNTAANPIPPETLTALLGRNDDTGQQETGSRNMLIQMMSHLNGLSGEHFLSLMKTREEEIPEGVNKDGFDFIHKYLELFLKQADSLIHTAKFDDATNNLTLGCYSTTNILYGLQKKPQDLSTEELKLQQAKFTMLLVKFEKKIAEFEHNIQKYFADALLRAEFTAREKLGVKPNNYINLSSHILNIGERKLHVLKPMSELIDAFAAIAMENILRLNNLSTVKNLFTKEDQKFYQKLMLTSGSGGVPSTKDIRSILTKLLSKLKDENAALSTFKDITIALEQIKDHTHDIRNGTQQAVKAHAKKLQKEKEEAAKPIPTLIPTIPPRIIPIPALKNGKYASRVESARRREYIPTGLSQLDTLTDATKKQPLENYKLATAKPGANLVTQEALDIVKNATIEAQRAASAAIASTSPSTTTSGIRSPISPSSTSSRVSAEVPAATTHKPKEPAIKEPDKATEHATIQKRSHAQAVQRSRATRNNNRNTSTTTTDKPSIQTVPVLSDNTQFPPLLKKAAGTTQRSFAATLNPKAAPFIPGYTHLGTTNINYSDGKTKRSYTYEETRKLGSFKVLIESQKDGKKSTSEMNFTAPL